MAKTPTLLLVLDGWGHRESSDWNAIRAAPAANFLQWWEDYPHALLSASGKEVGLPLGLMGNSEVGHLNIGAGRTVFQEITRIDQSIADGSFAQNGALRTAIEHAVQRGSNLHLLGLVSDGGVHSSDHHYRTLIELAADLGLPKEHLQFHALLDGRDTPPRSSHGYVRALEEHMAETGMGRIATISGRYYGMDRDTRWDRTKLFWDALVHGRGEQAQTALTAVEVAAGRGETDEFVLPTVIGSPSTGRLRSGDSLLLFNFRSDRVRQITEAVLFPDFDGFERGGPPPEVAVTTMTPYRADFPCAVAFPKTRLHSLFGEVIAERGLTQLRTAETEKYAHVTFFFNGGEEKEYAGETRVLIPSPKVATYDLQPEMSAQGVCEEVLKGLREEAFDVFIVNFANADMVGHTGIPAAAQEAVRAVDSMLGRIVEETRKRGGHVMITADHGNSEMMRDPATDEVHTAHTTNPVPLLLVSEQYKGQQLRSMGALCDVAPTLLQILGLEQPGEMDGLSMFER